MRKYFIVATIVLFSKSALADNFPWNGAELMIKIGVEMPLPNPKFSLNAHAVYFTVPSKDINMYFAYVGVKWKPFNWLWLMPMLAYAGNWAGTDGLDTSLSSCFSLFGGKATLFLEGDVILTHQQIDYYGYYSADYHLFRKINFGFHATQINDGVTFGPHIGITKGNLSIEFQYHVGFQDSNRGETIRAFTALNF